MYYYINRYYDPDTGRFITQDPLKLIDRPNPYIYPNNDPINFIDPYGLCGKRRGSWWERVFNWYFYESILPGPFGQPISEWKGIRPTKWGNLLKYTEEAGGVWKWGERVALGVAGISALSAFGLIARPKIVDFIKRNIAFEGPSPTGRIIQIRIKGNVLILRLDYHPLNPRGRSILHINIELAGKNIHIPLCVF